MVELHWLTVFSLALSSLSLGFAIGRWFYK